MDSDEYVGRRLLRLRTHLRRHLIYSQLLVEMGDLLQIFIQFYLNKEVRPESERMLSALTLFNAFLVISNSMAHWKELKR